MKRTRITIKLLDKIADYLLEKETITGAEMVAIIEGRDPALAEVTLDSNIEPPARAIHMVSEPVPMPPASTQEEPEQDKEPEGDQEPEGEKPDQPQE